MGKDAKEIKLEVIEEEWEFEEKKGGGNTEQKRR